MTHHRGNWHANACNNCNHHRHRNNIVPMVVLLAVDYIEQLWMVWLMLVRRGSSRKRRVVSSNWLLCAGAVSSGWRATMVRCIRAWDNGRFFFSLFFFFCIFKCSVCIWVFFPLKKKLVEPSRGSSSLYSAQIMGCGWRNWLTRI